MPSGRIMIVEDESLVAEDLQSCLARSGYEVVGIADTFDEAKHLAERARPDLALLDIRLKGPRDGIELAGELRRQNIGFVYLTSHGDEGTLARAEVTEPLGYVLKPFGAREMVPVLRTALYRHAADVRLRGLEHWLQTTLRSIGDGVVVTDVDGRITFANPVAEKLLRQRLRELTGLPVAQAMPLLDSGGRAVPCVAKRAMLEQAIVHVDPDCELVRGDDVRLPVDCSGAPVRDDDGSVTGAVVVLRDATTRRLVEEQRREADRRMRSAEKLESLGVLAGGLAHDLNNILTAILGHVAWGKGLAEPAAAVQESLHSIEENTHAAADLCRRMLAGAGAGPLVPEAVDVAATVREAVSRERALAGPGITFVSEGERDGLFAHADPVQWRQVLANLLRNAVEALAGRSGDVVARWGSLRLPCALLGERSKARTLAAGDYVWFEVADDGPGMTEDVQARVFEPFFTTKFTGRGLGLASVHGIVRRHGGAVDLDTEPDLGSRFRAFWPATKAPTPPTPQLASEPLPGVVLVVDDDDLVRRVTCRALRARGFTCHEAVDGAVALDLLRGGLAVDVVVLDVMMPGESGIDVLAELRRIRPGQPVLTTSGYCGIAEDLPRDGTHDFLPKPFTPDELVERVQRLRRRHS